MLNFFPKEHWSKTSEHQESTGPEIFFTGPEYRNGGNKIRFLGWQPNTFFIFVLGYQIVNFCMLVVPFKRELSFFLLLLQILDILQYLPHIFTS